MDNKRYAQSLTQTGILTYSLLTAKQRLGAIRNILYSIVQALLEVVSIGAFIPLFYVIINIENNGSSHYYKKIAVLTESLSWTSILILITLIFIVKNIITLVLVHHQSQYIKDVSVSFSKQLYQRFYQQSWTDYLKSNSAENIRKIKTAASDFANYILYNYLLLFADLCVCFFTLGGMMFLDFRIIIIVILICLPVSIIYYLLRRNVISKINTSFRDLTPKSSIVLTQGIDSFAETKLYQRENFFIDRFMKIRETTAQHLANLNTASSLPARFFEIAGILSFIAVIGYYKTYNFNQQNLIVLLGLLSITMYRIIPSINRILISISQIQAYSYAATELKEGFDGTTQEPLTDDHHISFTNQISIQNISYQYNGASNFQIKNTSLSIAKGDFIVLEGPSGAGKTTFIHILAGLIKEYEGVIKIDDEVLSSLTRHAWQQKIGIVPQFSIVLQDTILNNIAFGENENEIDLNWIKAVLTMTQLESFVSELPSQEKTQIGENGLTLSGGQRQRLILARALYRNPDVLLLDEVTNQLDEKNKIIILNTLKELAQKGKTIILASHDHAAREFTNRILYFDSGLVKEIKHETVHE